MTRRLSAALPVVFLLLSLSFVRAAAAGPPTLAWARAIDGFAEDVEVAAAEVLDPAGNIYVTGQRNDAEILTMKLDPSGRVIWRARAPFGSGAFGYGFAGGVGIARDHAGNIVVAGFSVLGHDGADYTTIKYDADGHFIWLNRYEGVGHGGGYPAAIAIDQNDNVFVTGSSYGGASGSDFATVKYSADGAERWVARYDGALGADYANGITIDALGRIVVVGQSFGVVGAEDIALVYYDEDGNQLKELRYDGPAHGNDTGWALASDLEGNVYVAGQASTDPSSDLIQAVLLKYSVDGSLAWAAFQAGPGEGAAYFEKVFVDSAGRVDVAGGSAEVHDFRPVVSQYDANGVQQWIARYTGPGGFSWPRAATVDDPGNIYITYKSPRYTNNDDMLTIKYSPDGTQQWLARYNDYIHNYDGPQAVAVDSGGGVCVLGTCSRLPEGIDRQDYGMTVVKYDSEGTQRFASPLALPGNGYDFASRIVNGADGRILVAGSSWGLIPPGPGDFMLLCFDVAGGLFWRAEIDSPMHLDVIAQNLEVAPSGNAYVAGMIENVGTGRDFMVAKFGPAGNQEWMQQFDGNGLSDLIVGLGIDSDENVYIAGTVTVPSPPLILYETATIKYDTHGNRQWVRRYDGQFGIIANANAMSVDEAGNTWVVFGDYGGPGRSNIGLIRYDRDGALQWNATYDGPQTSSVYATTMAQDLSGHAYVVGYTVPNEGMVIVRFSADGEQEWATLFERSTGGQPSAVRVDSFGNAYVTGLANGNSARFLAKFNTEGDEQWIAYRAGSSDTGLTRGEGLALDTAGNPYVNYTLSDGTQTSMTTIRYSTAGAEVWAASYSGSNGSGGSGAALTFDQHGNVLACGSDFSFGGDALVAKYLNCVSPGEMNVVGSVNGLAIQLFVECLLRGGEGCTCADVDGDGLVGASDVGPFVAMLLGEQ
ncbi:MAG TPA: SBBP repeat-containing protein [Phycisphaerae bacterium]|nr:SBBP repeat-containing protein [Phycisphaerae bacterium]